MSDSWRRVVIYLYLHTVESALHPQITRKVISIKLKMVENLKSMKSGGSDSTVCVLIESYSEVGDC